MTSEYILHSLLITKNTFQCTESDKEKSKDCNLGRRAMTRSAPVPGIECDCGKCCRKPNPSDCTSFYECDEVRHFQSRRNITYNLLWQLIFNFTYVSQSHRFSSATHMRSTAEKGWSTTLSSKTVIYQQTISAQPNLNAAASVGTLWKGNAMPSMSVSFVIELSIWFLELPGTMKSG